MSRIAQTVEHAREAGNKLLIPYLVAGDPDLATTLQLMQHLVGQGADIIELGIPFSDPSSDGPVIQRGVERALARGTRLQDVLDLVQEFRVKDAATPVVLMGYLNPIEIMGYQQFAASACQAGVDGVLIVDMPPAESADLHDELQTAGIDTIYLVAPTTSATRASAIVSLSTGYLYYVSLKGVTGAALTDHQSVGEKIAALRGLTDLPIVIGFGIKDAESAQAMGKLADGVVIGSALVGRIAELPVHEPQTSAGLQHCTAVIGVVRDVLNKIK
ncbi:MAG TPA: tryptophan synthase subunit alpha [Gammaproteobacteria bacterium]|jgi:tryptophan synthase alpha chain|nr:tryptophan synthase subunit alpha [Gammaproteobacteria bacterium]MDP6731761.1 tryptophan synthase subunit alpha [Gammaproteobacteria bacterium]HAJ75298.1 tryptophan synthase subunit alpha [Gammaproteobacteria bacterium]|tara:strand:+ start:799 stop:1617 length:819 start_codon:yes stop_codon:yes gene_type:complete